MSNKRLKDKAEIGRDLNDNDLIFVTKTNEDTDNPSTFQRVKNQITSYTTGLTEGIYTKGIEAGTNIYTGGTDLNPSVNISAATLSNLSVSGVSSLDVVTGRTLSIQESINNQSVIRSINLTEGATALAGVTVRNGATNYGLFGQFSSGYTGGAPYGSQLGHLAGKCGFANFVGDGLVIAAIPSSTKIEFFAGSILSSQKRAEISSTNMDVFVPLSASTISGGTFYGNGSGLTNVMGNELLTPVYLTYDGTSGTSSGTHGVTLTSPGNWTITNFGYIYYIDDKDGNIEVTIPDASASNEGKVFAFTKPRLVASNNRIILKTVSGQNIAQNPTFRLNSPDDVIQIVSNNFGANGGAEWKYRPTYRSINEPQVLRVSPEGTALFSTIKSAVDYANSYITGSAVILVEPGDYSISETINITKENLKILGRGSEITTLYATPALSGSPIFRVGDKSCDFENLKMSGSYETYAAIQFSGTPYCEMHSLVIDGFERGVCFAISGTEIWLFDSIVKNNTLAGVCNLGGASIGISEVTFENNGYGVNFYTGTTQRHSVQNSIFLVNTGQTGIQWWTDQNTYEYAFFTNNAFYGDGTYISGFTWNSIKDSDVRLENNAGLDNYKPESWIWVSGNTDATTLTTQNTYYEAVIGAGKIVDSDFTKFSGTGTNTSTTYLPNPTRKGIFTIAGDISASNNNDILSIALYKNGTTRLQDIDVRTTTAGQPYPFSFNGINNMDDSDTFDIRITNTGVDTRTATLRTLMFTITTN